jgi:ankyrin repeat protein
MSRSVAYCCVLLLLVACAASTAEDGFILARSAIVNGRSGELPGLIAAEPTINQRRDDEGRSLLHIAVISGQEEAATILIRAGVPVDMRSKDGATALHLAAAMANPALVKLLLQSGTKPTRFDRSGMSSLHCAVGSVACVTTLLEAGVPVDLCDRDGVTALHMAASLGELDSVRVLLDRGANLEAETAVRSTPLHLAALAGSAPVVAELLKRRADPNHLDARGRSALDRALPAVQAAIVTAGGRPGPQGAIETGPVVVRRVLDGESVEVVSSIGGKSVPVRVRLLWLRSPEPAEDQVHNLAGDPAFEELKRLLPAGTEVRLWAPGPEIALDTRNRLLAVATPVAGGPSIQEALLSAGVSTYWRRFGEASHGWHERLTTTQAEARTANRGVWKTSTAWMSAQADAPVEMR